MKYRIWPSVGIKAVAGNDTETMLTVKLQRTGILFVDIDRRRPSLQSKRQQCRPDSATLVTRIDKQHLDTVARQPDEPSNHIAGKSCIEIDCGQVDAGHRRFNSREIVFCQKIMCRPDRTLPDRCQMAKARLAHAADRNVNSIFAVHNDDKGQTITRCRSRQKVCR